MTKESKPSSEQRIINPCVQICVRDREDGICLGCGRTVQEINDWINLSKEDRKKIVTSLDDRLKALTDKRRRRRRGRKAGEERRAAKHANEV